MPLPSELSFHGATHYDGTSSRSVSLLCSTIDKEIDTDRGWDCDCQFHYGWGKSYVGQSSMFADRSPSRLQVPPVGSCVVARDSDLA